MQMEINWLFRYFFFLLIGGIKCIAGGSNDVLKWCLNRAGQARNTKAMKEMTGFTVPQRNTNLFVHPKS